MNRAWLFLLGVLLLVAAGCGGNSAPVNDVTQAYVGGLGGLAMSFSPGQPPAEVFDAGQGEFSVGVVIENLGESQIGGDSDNTYGYVELIGINPRQFGAVDQYQLKKTFSEENIELRGARRAFDGSIVSGDLNIVEFSRMSYQPDLFGNQPITIRANACYEYRTYSNTEICFKDDVLENAADDTICTLTGAKVPQNSGAPVQVTSVTQNPAGQSRIQVTFTVENLGPGLVFAPYSYQTQYGTSMQDDACLFSVRSNPNRDRVHVDVYLGNGFDSDYEVNCPLFGRSNEGLVTMFNGAPATVTCTIETFQDGSRIFTDSLNVDLWYSYFDYIETPVLIRDTNLGFDDPGGRQNN